MKCETCRWYGDGKPHGIPNDGACHYQPPFPRVRPEDWCSHWAIRHDPDPTIERMIVQLERTLVSMEIDKKCATEAIRRNEEEIMGKIKNLNYWNVMWLHNNIGQEIWL